jgi:hypothetical protein
MQVRDLYLMNLWRSCEVLNGPVTVSNCGATRHGRRHGREIVYCGNKDFIRKLKW